MNWIIARCTLPFAMTWVLAAADWPQWRGPLRDGTSEGTGLLSEWPPDGPPLAWRVTGLGAGFASVAVSNGRVYTQGQQSESNYLIALDEQTGERIWRIENGGSYTNRRGGGPRGTPTVEGGVVYALNSDGSLVAARASSGERLWSTNLLTRFQARNISWGLSESPLIDGQRMIVNAGAGGASIVALDKSNGNVLWKSLSDEAGYSSAMVAEAGGIRHYVLLTGEGAVGVRASDGALLWRYDRVSNRTANVATPIVHDHHVFVSSDYGTGGALLQLIPVGDGVRAEEVYFSREMRNHYSSSVLIDGYLYGYSSRVLTAMNFKTGEVAWKDRSVGKGHVITAEGKLYLWSEDGVAGLAEATPSGYREISRFSVPHGDLHTWTLPVIANGRLYLRDQDTLSCYDIRQH